jgi:hypothetical protein
VPLLGDGETNYQLIHVSSENSQFLLEKLHMEQGYLSLTEENGTIYLRLTGENAALINCQADDGCDCKDNPLEHIRLRELSFVLGIRAFLPAQARLARHQHDHIRRNLFASSSNNSRYNSLIESKMDKFNYCRKSDFRWQLIRSSYASYLKEHC